MQYAIAATRVTNRSGTGTKAHIARGDGRGICGVKATYPLESLAGWNLCIKCQRISEAK